MVGPRSPSSNLAVESNATRHFLSRTTIPVRGTARGRDSRARFARNRESWVFVFSPAGFIVAALFENVARMLLSIEIGQNCSISRVLLRTYTWRGRRPILLSSIYFPDRKLIGNTCIAVVHGQTTGAETGRSSGGIRVYVCVYAVNAMNHLDSFKSDVVNPTLSPSLSLVLILVRFSSLCSFGLSSGHGWSAVWSDRGTYGHRHFHRIREISGDRIERREGRRGGKRWPQLVGSWRVDSNRSVGVRAVATYRLDNR